MKRIKYISEFAGTVDADEIESISLKSRLNNMRVGITGMLVASGGVFVQLIEGPDDAVDSLYERI